MNSIGPNGPQPVGRLILPFLGDHTEQMLALDKLTSELQVSFCKMKIDNLTRWLWGFNETA